MSSAKSGILYGLSRVLNIKFTKTILVGGGASLADWGCLVLLVEALGFHPDNANLPSLLVGASLQFFGNRHLVFKSTNKKALPQVFKFILGELATLGMNYLGFHLFVVYTQLDYRVVRPVVTFLVFVFFSYPLWRKIFSKV